MIPERNKKKIRSLYFSATKDVMVSVALADGKVEEAEIKEIMDCFEKITSFKLEKDMVLETIDEIREHKYTVSQIASSISPYLNDMGKETVLRSAIAIAKSDGIVQGQELKMLHSLADDLLLPKAYANGIFTEESIEKK